MVNDINGINTRRPDGPRQSATSGDVRGSQADKSESAESGESSDVVVELSQSAQLEAAVARLAGEPAVDSVRVAEVREQLRKGDYQLDPNRIAQKLVAQDSEY